MMATISILYLLVLYLATQAHSSQFVSQDLVNFIKENSDPAVIPQTSLDKPIEVSISVGLINIRNVDLTTKDVELDAWIFLKWNAGLTFDPSDFNNLQNVRLPAFFIWRPDLALYNGRITFPQNDNIDNFVVYEANGDVLWVPQVTLRTTCDVNRHQIFFNTTCNMKIGSWTYSGDYINLKDDPTWDLSNYLGYGSSFEVLDASAEKHTSHYSCCPESYQDIGFSFSFKKTSFV